MSQPRIQTSKANLQQLCHQLRNAKISSARTRPLRELEKRLGDNSAEMTLPNRIRAHLYCLETHLNCKRLDHARIERHANEALRLVRDEPKLQDSAISMQIRRLYAEYLFTARTPAAAKEVLQAGVPGDLRSEYSYARALYLKDLATVLLDNNQLPLGMRWAEEAFCHLRQVFIAAPTTRNAQDLFEVAEILASNYKYGYDLPKPYAIIAEVAIRFKNKLGDAHAMTVKARVCLISKLILGKKSEWALKGAQTTLKTIDSLKTYDVEDAVEYHALCAIAESLEGTPEQAMQHIKQAYSYCEDCEDAAGRALSSVIKYFAEHFKRSADTDYAMKIEKLYKQLKEYLAGGG